MDKEQCSKWLQDYDKSYPIFEWFITQYTPDYIITMEWVRREPNITGEQKVYRLRGIMNDIWFELPDKLFNIIENPKGWALFLNLLET